MKLAVVGHSLVHIRQQNFFREVAREGYQVVLYCPKQWGPQVARPYFDMLELDGQSGTLELKPLRVSLLSTYSGNDPGNDQSVTLNNFRLLGLEQELTAFGPDVIYVQQEPESELARQVKDVVKAMPNGRSVRTVLFTWENLVDKPSDPMTIEAYDLIICGNDAAEVRMQRYNQKTAILPQVGVDTDHFQRRDIPFTVDVGYVGRPVVEKGLPQLLRAYPMTRVLDWCDYRELPWHYSETKIVVCFSQDTKQWREQAMPYVAVEAMCNGCAVITSDAGSIPFWLGPNGFTESGCPGVVIAQQHDIVSLELVIRKLLEKEHVRERFAHKGREWVEQYLGNRVIAARLIKVLNDCVTQSSNGEA